jgi:acetyl esterase/lipase
MRGRDRRTVTSGRGWRLVVLCAVVASVATACANVPPPAGAAPLRYRDVVFGSVSTTSNIPYGVADDQFGIPVTLYLDLYQPAGDTVAKRPAIVWVHGGAFSSGDKTSPELVDEARVFASKGYVNVSIDYRLAPGGCSFASPTDACRQGIVDAQHDAQAAVRWLRVNATTYRIDPNRIAIGGTSAGAITALQVAYRPYDPGTSGNSGVPSNVEAVQSLSGTALPTSLPGPGAPPAILFHGTDDPLVPYTYAVQTMAAAQARHDVALLESFPGAGHVPYQFRDVILDQTANFLYAYLDLAHAQR